MAIRNIARHYSMCYKNMLLIGNYLKVSIHWNLLVIFKEISQSVQLKHVWIITCTICL